MSNNKRKITTTQIAREAGVSQATVANILNSTPGMKYSDKTKEKVLAVSRRLGYQVSAVRRAVKTSFRNVGMVVASQETFAENFMNQVLCGVYGECSRKGYSMMACENPGDISDNNEGVMMSQKILELGNSGILDGLLIDKGHIASSQLEKISDLKIPHVYINGRGPSSHNTNDEEDFEAGIHMVSINHYKGGITVARHLQQLGHERIGVLSLRSYGEKFAPYRHLAMVTGFQYELEKQGIAYDNSLYARVDPKDISTIMAEVDMLLSLPEPPTALFITDDAVAKFVTGYLISKGLGVPADISVFGYGGLPEILVSFPRLTTMSAPWEKMGRLGVEMLLELIKSGKTDTDAIVLDPVLIYGQTVGPRRL